MNLTKKELEILELAEQGLDNNEICKKLNIKYSNLKTQFSNIYKKFNLDKKNGKLRSQAIKKYKRYYKLDIDKIIKLANGIIYYNSKYVVCRPKIEMLANKIIELITI